MAERSKMPWTRAISTWGNLVNHQGAELQRLAGTVEGAGLVVGGHNIWRAIQQAPQERLEFLTAGHALTALVQVLEGFYRVACLHSCQVAALLLLDLGADGALVVPRTGLPDVDQGNLAQSLILLAAVHERWSVTRPPRPILRMH